MNLYSAEINKIKQRFDRSGLHETDQYRAVAEMLQVVVKYIADVEKKIDGLKEEQNARRRT